MDSFVRLLSRDELFGVHQARRRDVQGVHCAQAGLGRFHSCESFNSLDVPEPDGASEVLFVEQLLQPFSMEDRFWDYLEVNERAGEKLTVRFFEKMEGPLLVRANRSDGCEQHTRIAESSDHATLSSRRRDGPQSRARVPVESAFFHRMLQFSR